MANRNEEKNQKITLKGYYDDLPDASCPKTEFVNRLANLCHTSATTVRNWIRGVAKPKKEWRIDIIARETGISKECLWND